MESQLKDVCGVPSYLAPEMIDSDRFDSGYGKPGQGFEVDVWSLGVVALSACFGMNFFKCQGEHMLEGMQMKQNAFDLDKVLDQHSNAMPMLLRDLLRGLLQLNPKHRITAEKIICHPLMVEKDNNPHEDSYWNWMFCLVRDFCFVPFDDLCRQRRSDEIIPFLALLHEKQHLNLKKHVL